MKKLIWTILLLATIIVTAHANGPVGGVPVVEKVPIENIQKALKSYADGVGCGFIFDQKNVVELDINGDGGKDLVALFVIDNGCSGGSGMATSGFAVLKFDFRGEVFVRPEMSQPASPSFGFPPFIDRIFLKGNQLWYSGREHDWAKDARCCPSVPVEGQVFLREGVVRVDGNQSFGAWYWLSMRKP